MNREDINTNPHLFENSPLKQIYKKPNLNEILICGPESIWYEENGVIKNCEEIFFTQNEFHNFIRNLSERSHAHLDLIQPHADGSYEGFRVHMTAPPITKNYTVSLRRKNTQSLSLQDLTDASWCSSDEMRTLQEILRQKQNLLILGPTGSGKTTLLNSLLKECPEDRILTIEDTDEIELPNRLSTKLLTRSENRESLPIINQEKLLRQCLRMRPDRIVMGEVRGAEARDFLLALSTGHGGSLCTLHASDPREALMRLEMLVQMAAPEWNIHTIRRLIWLSVDRLLITKKSEGQWRLNGIYKIANLEEFGFTLDKCK